MAVPLCRPPHVQAPAPGQLVEAAEARGYEALPAVVPDPGRGGRGAAARHVRHARARVPQSLPGSGAHCAGGHDARHTGKTRSIQ